VPIAPGLGLVLDQVHYDRYNTRYGADGFHENLNWEDFESAIKEFREKYIQPTIVDSELTDGPMQAWLPTLELHSYDERVGKADNNGEESEGISSDDENPTSNTGKVVKDSSENTGEVAIVENNDQRNKTEEGDTEN